MGIKAEGTCGRILIGWRMRVLVGVMIANFVRKAGFTNNVTRLAGGVCDVDIIPRRATAMAGIMNANIH